MMVPKINQSLLVILILSSYLIKCSLSYRYSHYARNSIEDSILDSPVQNVKVHKNIGILPQAASFLTRPTNYLDSTRFKHQKKSDLVTSKLLNYNNFRQVSLYHEYPRQHRYTVEPKLLNRVSRNRIPTSEVKLFKGANQLNDTLILPDLDKGHLLELYSMTSKSNAPTKYDIFHGDSSNGSILSQKVSNSSQQNNLPVNQEMNTKVLLSAGEPLMVSNTNHSDANATPKIPLMVRKMISKNNSHTNMTETFDKDIKYMISKTISDPLKKLSIVPSKSLHPTSSSSNQQESIFQNIIEDSTLPTYDTTSEITESSFEETNELPNPFNLFENVTNTQLCNSVHNCKNHTNKLSNRIYHKIVKLKPGKKTEMQNENEKNASNLPIETLDSQDHYISEDKSHFSKTKIELNLESPVKDKFFADEGIPTNSFNKIDESSKISKIMSTLDLLMEIIDSKNSPKTNTKLQTQNMVTRVSDIRSQFNTGSTDEMLMANQLYNDFEMPLPASIPPHLVPLGPNGAPLFKSIATNENYKKRKLNITERFPFLTQITTTSRPTTPAALQNRDHGMQSLIGRVLDRMTEDPDVRDGMMNGMLAVAPIAMLAIMSSVDLPALLLAPFAAVLPTFLFGSMGDSVLSVSPSSGIQGSHNLNLSIGGMESGQSGTSEPQPPEIVSNDPLANEMAETLYPHLHSLIEFILG